MPRQSTKKVTKLESLEKTLKKLYKNAEQNNDQIEQILEAIKTEKRNQSIKFLREATAEELSFEKIQLKEITELDSYSLEGYIYSIKQKRRSIMRKYARTHAKINAKIRAAYKLKTLSESASDFTKEEMEGFINAMREYDKDFDGLDWFEDEFEDPFYHGFVEDGDYDEDMF
jgi:hypothetical protein